MDLYMLMRDSKRLCAQGAQKPCTGSSATGFAVVENPDMGGSLWSRLPEDLVDRVLAWLPAASLLRLRTVCRRWSKIMATKCFLEVCTQVNRHFASPSLDAQVASHQPYFVKISDCEYSRSLLSFDPSVHKWHNLPLSYLPTSQVVFPVSSAGGLICFINKVQSAHMETPPEVQLFVSNPFTKTWKELPPVLCKQRPVLVHMVMWKRPSHYKVMVAGMVTTEIFDSLTAQWRKSGCLPRGEEPSHNVAYCNGSLYCLTPRWYNCVFLAFSFQHEVWSKVKIGRLPGYCQFRSLVACAGHIVMVGKSVRQQVLAVCVWMLEWKTMKWRETGRMPQSMSDRFLGRPSESFCCCGHGDFIFFTSDRCDMALLFHLRLNVWRWVLGCPHLDGFSFEPRLDSQV